MEKVNQLPPPAVLREFLGHFSGKTPAAQPIRGGFSGAQVWRIDAGRAFCLRGWPTEHPTLERLKWIHAVLGQAGRRGLTYVPQPLPAADGYTFAEHAARRWELSTWLPGRADFRAAPSRLRLENAALALARFHQATVTNSARSEPIPGLIERQFRLGELLGGRFTAIASAVAAAPSSPLIVLAREVLPHFSRFAPTLEHELSEKARVRLPLQPCIRDVHCEHILYTSDEVAGLVDYGAMRLDCVIGDLVRMLGSLVDHDQAEWAAGIAAYSAVRSVSDDERGLIAVWRRSSLLLSAINWLDWLFLEQRQFPDLGAVELRLASIHRSLAALG